MTSLRDNEFLKGIIIEYQGGGVHLNDAYKLRQALVQWYGHL